MKKVILSIALSCILLPTFAQHPVQQPRSHHHEYVQPSPKPSHKPGHQMHHEPMVTILHNREYKTEKTGSRLFLLDFKLN